MSQAVNPPFGPFAEAIVRAAEGAGIGLSIVAVDGGAPRYLFLSKAGAAHLGYPLDEILRLGVMATIAPDERVVIEQRLAARLRGEKVPRAYETAVIGKDGRRIPLEISATDIEIDGRTVAVTFFSDISERRRAEEALRASEARFRQLIELAPEAVWIVDGRKLLFANPQLARILGHESASELVGRSPLDIVHPDDHAPMIERTRQMMLDGKSPGPRDYRAFRRDGSTVVVEVSSIPIPFEGAQAVLCYGRDVTERKRLQSQLVQNDRLAALGTMAAGVAHEINNPLTYSLLGIDRATRVLTESATIAAEERTVARAQLDEARHGIERVAAIVRQLRTFSRFDPEAHVPTDPRDAVAAAVKLGMNEIRHRARLETDLGPVPLVDGDLARLEQVVLNLLINAAQALPDGQDEAHAVRVVTRTDDEGRAVIEVSDTGSGVAPEVLPHIFDPFFTTKPAGEGTGLGLFICHGIVASHGGRLTVASEPGRGTTFRAILPPSDRQSRPAGSGPAASPRPQPAAGAGTERRRRVMVVEDEERLSAMLVQMLERDYAVVCAANGRVALEALSAEAPCDAILCDLMMPGMSGIDLHAEIAHRRPGLERRFVFMTGGAFTPRASAFLSEVPNLRLDKPFGYDRLRDVLGRLFAATG